MNQEVNIDNKKKKLKIYYSLLITVICIIGVSFAWFRLYLSQSEDNTLASRTCFSTSLTEDTSKIELTDAFPISNEDGLKGTPFTFTIKNNCSNYVKAYITIKSTYRTSTDSAYLKDNYIKVNISPKDTTKNPSVVLGSQTLTDLDNNSKGYIIVDTGLNSNEEKSYDLRIWMDSAVTTEQGLDKIWAGKIVVITSAIQSPILLNKAILNNNKLNTPLTTPGIDISLASEALLADAEDDYGISYYFRGNVKNNYVEFANKCWRIVRIAGDGTTKLILHNDNINQSINPCSSTNNSNDAAFARYSGSTYRSAFNTNVDDNAYVGFMYGETEVNDYTSTHANTTKSTILTNLETWYTNNLASYEENISDTIWCTDKTNVTDTDYRIDGWKMNGLGYNDNETYYEATKRLRQNDDNETGPSLKCNGALNKVQSKIGLLSADEIAYAGYAYNINNQLTYLKENTGNTEWWSLSPYAYYNYKAIVWIVYQSYDETIFVYDDVDNLYGIRPSISLVSSVNVIGAGTPEDPYKVV